MDKELNVRIKYKEDGEKKEFNIIANNNYLRIHYK